MKSCYVALFIVAMLWFVSTSIYAYDITLQWEPSHGEDVAGYMIYSKQNGNGSQQFERISKTALEEFDPADLSAVATELQGGVEYFFVVTAYNSQGSESGFSNVVGVKDGIQMEMGLSASSAPTQDNENSGGNGCFFGTVVRNPENQ